MCLDCYLIGSRGGKMGTVTNGHQRSGESYDCWMFCFLYFRAHGSRKFPGPGLPEGQLELSVSFEVVPTSFSACLCFVANVVVCFVSLILSHTQTAVLKNNPS